MSLAKRDFNALAAALRAANAELDPNDPVTVKIAFANLRDDIARICAKHNPHFDRAKFLAACQVKGRVA